jgi:hypothetical protein
VAPLRLHFGSETFNPVLLSEREEAKRLKASRRTPANLSSRHADLGRSDQGLSVVAFAPAKSAIEMTVVRKSFGLPYSRRLCTRKKTPYEMPSSVVFMREFGWRFPCFLSFLMHQTQRRRKSLR